MHLTNDEKLQCAAFARTNDILKEGEICWIALDKGEILQFNVQSGEIDYRSFSHVSPVKIIIRGKKGMYTIDDNGGLKIWEINPELGIVDLRGKSKSMRIQPRQLFAIVANNLLWTTSLKSIDIYNLNDDADSFQLMKLEVGMGIGSITGITFLDRREEMITAHDCGKVTVYNSITFEKKYCVQLTSYKIQSILAVGESMVWVGFGTGKIIIYRLNEKGNWRAILDFQAYVNSGVVSLDLDDTSLLTAGNLTIMSVSDGGIVKFWNGLLTDYYKG